MIVVLDKLKVLPAHGHLSERLRIGEDISRVGGSRGQWTVPKRGEVVKWRSHGALPPGRLPPGSRFPDLSTTAVDSMGVAEIIEAAES